MRVWRSKRSSSSSGLTASWRDSGRTAPAAALRPPDRASCLGGSPAVLCSSSRASHCLLASAEQLVVQADHVRAASRAARPGTPRAPAGLIGAAARRRRAPAGGPTTCCERSANLLLGHAQPTRARGRRPDRACRPCERGTPASAAPSAAAPRRARSRSTDPGGSTCRASPARPGPGSRRRGCGTPPAARGAPWRGNSFSFFSCSASSSWNLR